MGSHLCCGLDLLELLSLSAADEVADYELLGHHLGFERVNDKADYCGKI